MEISVLGCGGSRGINSRPTAFLIDGKLLIDVGTATEALALKEIAAIDNIFITHAHFDHICDLPFLVEAVFDARETPICLHGIKHTIDAISSHIFNQKIWPDFSRIPTAKLAKIYYHTLFPLQKTQVGSYSILPIPMNHTIPTVGYLVDNEETAFSFTADTHVTDQFWEISKSYKKLKAVIVETSFPNRFVEMAKITGHLTPELLAGEITKLNRNDVKIYVSHIKPFYNGEVVEELTELSKNLPINLLEDCMEIKL